MFRASLFPAAYGTSTGWRYHWKAALKTKDRHKHIRSILYEYYNGAEETLFGKRTWRENQIEKYRIPPYLQYDYLTGRAVPHKMVISRYGEDDVRYGVASIFDETEIFDAFSEAFSGRQDISGELIVELCGSASEVDIFLIAGERQIRLGKTEVEVYKSGYQEQ